MNKKFNILILLLLLFISAGAVSAADEGNDTVASADDGLLAASYTVTSDTYSTYFSSNGYTTNKLASGDTVNLDGSFSNKNFVIDKKLTVIGTSSNSLKDCNFTIVSGGSGSVVSNLNIANTAKYTPGIFLSGAGECTISNNNIKNTGASSYAICLSSGSNNNSVILNTLETYGETYGHGSRSTPVIVLGSSNYNYIANNQITCADANAIYLSEYGGGSFSGGSSYFNTIYKNTIKYSVVPTSWAYAIQMMGGNNTADSNTIVGAYRGISSSSLPGNIVINNKLINLTGKDYQTGNLVGGDYGIAISGDSIVRNNTIENAFLIGAAISAGDSSLVESNNVKVTGTGYGIQAEGNDVEIQKNIIDSTSAGVYQQGKFEGVVINNNTINSNSAVGILIKKSSSKRFPSDITVTNNVISTSNSIAIDASEADKTSYVIRDNTIPKNSKILTPDGEVDPSEPVYVFDGITYTVTPSNYSTFFDSNGNLASFVKKGDILNFVGTFSDKIMQITEGIKITGVNPILLNSTIYVTSSDVWIEKLTINNKNTPRLNAWGIKVEDTDKVKIVDNDITVQDLNAAYAVYVYRSGNVEVSNNRLSSTGNYLTFTLLALGADNCKFANNTISTVGTSEVYGYEGDKCIDGENNIPEIYRTYGILLIRSSENTVSGNDVTVTSLLDKTYPTTGSGASTNSLVGIDIYFESDSNTVSDNTVSISGNDNYMYGMGVLGAPTGSGASISANANEFNNNKIVIDGTYFGTGIIAGYSSKDTKINGNDIEVVANNVAYGITCEMSESSDIKNNELKLNAEVIYGVELYSSDDNTLNKNIIDGTGKAVYGVTLVNAHDNVITDNKITADGNGQAISFNNLASTTEGNAGIRAVGNATGNLIDNNEITSKIGYAVDLDKTASNNNVTNNYLSSQKGKGNAGVNNTAGNTVKNNYGETFTNVKVDSVSAPYLDTAQLSLTVDTNANGAKVEFYIDNNYVGQATVSNGKASLSYKLNGSYARGTHTIKAILSKDSFKDSEATGVLTVTKGKLTVKVADVSSKDGYPAAFSATITNSLGEGVSGITVRFYRNSAFIGSATTNDKGVASANFNVPKGLSGSYTILANADESANYLASNGTGRLTISNMINTEIVANDITMYFKDGTRFEATIQDLNGKAIGGVDVVLTINGNSYTRNSDNQGKVSIPLNLNSGTYDVTCKFNGKDNYSASESAASVTILPTLKGRDIVKMYKNATQYAVQVFDTTGKPLANTDVKFNINGVFYTRSTDTSGVARLTINLNPGVYIITTENPSNGEKISNTVTVKSLLVENYDVNKYYRNASKYTLRVIKQDGSAAGEGEEVTLNINGVFYKRTTNATGYINMNINLQPGEYIVTAEYRDCRVSNFLTIRPVLYAGDITMNYRDGTRFKTTLLDGQGKVYANQSVTFNINGVFYQRTTDNLGIASLAINLMPGKYIITSTYNEASIANTITIN